jgi:cytochrome c
VWTAEKLDPYLKNPREVVPGTTMAYAGLRNDDERANLIAYLATLK